MVYIATIYHRARTETSVPSKRETMTILRTGKQKTKVTAKWEFRCSHRKMSHTTIVIVKFILEDSPARFVSQRSDIRKNYSALSQKKAKNVKILNL